MSERFSRADRLYILAKALTDKHLTPDSNTYAGFIIGVSAANFYRDKTAALEDAETLTSAYKADKWQSILYGVEGTDGTIEIEQAATETQGKVESNTPTLNTLKTFNLTGPCTPIKKLAPKPKPAQETEASEYEQALILLALARRNIWCGAGSITLSQARYELENKTLTIDDVKRLIDTQLPGIETEKRSGPSLAFFLEGKNTVKNKRAIKIVIPETPPELSAPKNEYYKEPPLEKAYFKGKKVNW
jgi:hypothetical protein